jgi:hypothetical protein
MGYGPGRTSGAANQSDWICYDKYPGPNDGEIVLPDLVAQLNGRPKGQIRHGDLIYHFWEVRAMRYVWDANMNEILDQDVASAEVGDIVFTEQGIPYARIIKIMDHSDKVRFFEMVKVDVDS